MNRIENWLKSNALKSWVGKQVQHNDDGMFGYVVNVVYHEGLLRVCWDDDSVDRHTTDQLTIVV